MVLLGFNDMVKSMNLAWISVSDYAKAKKFFTEQLGLKVVSDAPEFGWVELQGSEGGFTLGVAQEQIKSDEDIRPGSNAIVTMTVADIAKARATLQAKGVRCIGDILEVPGHVKLALFADSDGNKFQLVEEVSK